MELEHGSERFSTRYVQNNAKECAGIEIIREGVAVAAVTYWDAIGQFSVETIGGEIPLAVMEAAIQEARSKIKLFLDIELLDAR